MTMLSYSLPASRDEFWAKGTYGDVKFEVPAVFSPDGSCDAEATAARIGTEVVDQYIARRTVELVTSQIARGDPIRDCLYAGGEIQRADYTVSAPQAAEIVAELEAAFPGAADYTSRPANLIGRYDAYRAPYENPSISWYEMGPPPSSLLGDYGASTYASYMDWYGLKFDLVTRKILLKVVVGADCFDSASLASLPRGGKFFARIHGRDGSVSPQVDCYVMADHAVMEDYCSAGGHPFPCPDESIDSVWLYGVTFDINTRQIEVVKAYERTPATA